MDNNYALVGGGARTFGWSRDGGFLTESRPNASLTSWIGRSKDHIREDPHYITVYAIGMRIDGVTPEYLKSKIQLFTSTSPVMNHPYTYTSFTGNYLLIGGGAWDNYNDYGNMLVDSYPINTTTWYVEGKDHRRADPCRITGYAIAIENISFPNVGYLQVQYPYPSAYGEEPYGWCTSGTTVSPGWALTCCAGNINYAYYGRMMLENYPFPFTDVDVWLYSKDHSYKDYGWQYTYALRIRKAN